jgi:hypothetical protein
MIRLSLSDAAPESSQIETQLPPLRRNLPLRPAQIARLEIEQQKARGRSPRAFAFSDHFLRQTVLAALNSFAWTLLPITPLE